MKMADSASDLNINEEYSKINSSSTKTFNKRMKLNQQKENVLTLIGVFLYKFREDLSTSAKIFG